MKKQRAFTLAEIMVVMVIIGIVMAFGVPLVVNDARHKIQNTGFYEAYRALYEGAKRAKLSSPTGMLDVYRRGRFGISVCDLFASVYSVSDIDLMPDAAGNLPERAIKTTPRCLKDEPDDKTGLCHSDCALIDDPERCSDGMPPIPCSTGTKWCCSDETTPVKVTTKCPMGLNYESKAYSDKDCTVEAKDGDVDNYCRPLPTYITQYGIGCEDYITHLTGAAAVPFRGIPGSDRVVLVDRDVSSSNLGYNTNFDTLPSDIKPNFTTSNGLTFYGLDTYPSGVAVNFKELMFAERQTTGRYIYRDVYIDTNGKSEHPHASCDKCDTSGYAYDKSFIDVGGPQVDLAHKEAVGCAKQLECLKKNFGVYKFRLYNNGRVEPITNRTADAAKDTKMRYKLVYVANRSIIDVEKLFESYDEAREYEIPAHEKDFVYWNKNELRTALGWYSNDNAVKPDCCYSSTCTCNNVKGWFDKPCQYDMDTLECSIIPIIPEVHAVPIKRKTAAP